MINTGVFDEVPMLNKAVVALMLSLFSLGAYSGEYVKSGPALVYHTQGSFKDVKGYVVDAISEQGMVISYVSHVQAMLDRTAQAAGIKDSVYDKAEIILTCKSGLSHDLARANPHNIVLCPWGIAVYTLKGKPGTVYISIREPYQGDTAYLAIHKLLQEIVSEAVDN